MTAVVLVRGDEPDTISLHRCRLAQRLVVWARAPELDRRLAGGASPDASVSLSLRAQSLISARTRRRLSRSLRRILEEARGSLRPFYPTVPLARREILASRGLIDELADALAGPAPVDARGVAQVELLLSDGASPFYQRGVAGILRPALLVALELLGPPPSIHAEA